MSDRRAPLSDDAIEAALSDLDGWRLAPASGRDDGANRLVREWTLPDVPAAAAFIVRVLFAAEAADHHPEISSVYTRVSLALATHDAGDRVTATDLDLARRIDEM